MLDGTFCPRFNDVPGKRNEGAEHYCHNGHVKNSFDEGKTPADLRLEIGDLKIDVKTLQNTFWKDVVVDTCQLILKHCKLARSSLNKIVLIVNPKMFDTFISSIEKTAQNTLVEQKNAKDFIKTY